MANILADNKKRVVAKESGDLLRDSRTHIRVGNRLVGKEIVNIQMKGRIYVPLENLNTAETEKLHLDDEDWVTAGVVHRRVTGSTQSGRPLFYLQITDMKDTYVTLFPHGSETQYPTIPQGGLVYILNPTIIPSRDGTQKVALSISNSRCLIHIGQAVDYGVCCATQRNGLKCMNAVNKEVSRYCLYHIRKTQEDVNTMRCEVSTELLTKNIIANNLSEGRFQIGKEVIDFRKKEQKQGVSIAKLAGLKECKTQIVDGVRVGGYVASRMLEKKKEEERKRRRKEESELPQKKSQCVSLDSVPLLGRGVSSNGMVDLEEDENDRLQKMHEIREKLDQLQEKKKTEKKEQAKQIPLTPTGNSVFDSLMKATTSSLEQQKEEVLKKRSAYAEKELREQLRIAQEREALLEKKEEERLKVTSLDVVCYWCHNCKKFVESGLGREYCEFSGHYLEIRHEKKRMFECMQCHSRKSFIGTEKPVTPCGCGNVLWCLRPFFKEKAVKTEKLKITPDSVHLLYCHEAKTGDWICLFDHRIAESVAV